MRIAIVGSGVMGLSCAWFLIKQQDIEITLFTDPDKQPASYCAGGMLAPFSESDSLSPQLQSLSFQQTIPFWRGVSTELDIFFQEKPTLVLAHAPDEALLKRFIRALPKDAYRSLSAAQIQDLEPGMHTRFRNALSVRDEAFLDTRQVLDGMSSFIRQRAVWKEVAVEPQQLTSSFDWIIDCRGIHSPLPGLRPIKGERFLLSCPDLSISHCIRLMHPRYPIYIVPHAQGRYMVGATMLEDNIEPRVTTRSCLELLSAFSSLHRNALESEIVTVDAGFRPTFRDHLPGIVINSEQPQTIACNGLYRHGFLLAPLLAKAVLQMLKQQSVDADYQLFLKGNYYATAH